MSENIFDAMSEFATAGSLPYQVFPILSSPNIQQQSELAF